MEQFLEILRLVLIGLLPPLFALGLYFLERKTRYGNLKPLVRQIIAGVLFGCIAILATEFGSKVDGSVLNVRDAAAVTAGLLYGWPGGLIAGLIGGVERFASAYWRDTYYTQIACSVSTLVSGLLAGMLRGYVFRAKTPTAGHALIVALMAETFHMLMIFLTNARDPGTAFQYVNALGNKMITANVLSAVAAIGLVSLVDFLLHRKKEPVKQKTRFRIRTYAAWSLSLIGVVTILVSATLTYGLNSSTSYTNSIKLLSLGVRDAIADVEDTSDNTILSLATKLRDVVEEKGSAPDDTYLLNILPASGVSEIHYFNMDGAVAATTVPASHGFDLFDPAIDEQGNAQALEFRSFLLDPIVTEFVQDFMPTFQDPNVKKKYAAVKVDLNGDKEFDGFVQVGFDATDFYASIREIVTQVVQNRHISESGYMLVCDESMTIYSRMPSLNGRKIAELGFPDALAQVDAMYRQQRTIQDTDSFYMFDTAEGFYVIAVVSVSEMHLSRDMSTFLGVYMEILIFGFLFLEVYFLIDRLVLRDLGKANDKLAKITAGDLDQVLTDHKTFEMVQLADSINTTVDSLKGYIAKEASRYDEELSLGKQIQMSSLPNKGAYLFRHDFAVYGNMSTAKQVGGDFYDYFLLNDTRLVFLIADVSGKGIPGAMFMMKTKSIIESLLESGLPLADLMRRANDSVCEGNETETFVTMWLGICDLTTGLVEYVNAGHNPPMVCQNGHYERLEMKRDLVLGAMKGVPYRRQTIQLQPGDTIFLYTDGVTEAESAPESFYGEKRLLDCLGSHSTCCDPFKICGIVENDVHAFVNGHEQSDDMTMVSFAYLGIPKQRHFSFPSTSEGVGTLCDEVAKELADIGIDEAHIDRVRLICEEVAANIAFHAYEGTKGIGELDLCVNVSQICLTFSDSGPQFNPLEKKDPNINLSADERPIGGLGIYMVKKTADKIFYAYQEARNVLLIYINR